MFPLNFTIPKFYPLKLITITLEQCYKENSCQFALNRENIEKEMNSSYS